MEMNFKPVSKKQERVWIKLMNYGSKLGCHQLSERSFFCKGFQFPLCARCTGIVIGEILLAPLSLLFFETPYWVSIIFISIMAIDGGLQYFNILQSNNIRRLITGILAGYGYTNLLIFFIKLIINLLK